MHSSRMRTARLLIVSCSIPCISGGGGGSAQPPLMQNPSPMQTPGCRLPAGCRPPGHVTCDACWEANPLVDRRNDTRLWKHYIPATTVAGGNETNLGQRRNLDYMAMSFMDRRLVYHQGWIQDSLLEAAPTYVFPEFSLADRHC